MFELPKLSWKAVRRGAIYCAPACGGRCTWAAYQKATRDARKLARRMGKGWKPRVWENLGWHYEVISPCGRIKIDSNTHQGSTWYGAMLGPKNSPGGNWVANGDTPEQARDLVVKAAKKSLKQLGAVLKGL